MTELEKAQAVEAYYEALAKIVVGEFFVMDPNAKVIKIDSGDLEGEYALITKHQPPIGIQPV